MPISRSDTSNPPGSRFVVVTPHDHSAWIWLSTLLALTHSLCFLPFRAIVKWNRIAADDVVLAAAYVLALCHWITEFIALRNGLGRSSHFLTDAQEQKVSNNVFASRILLLTALCLAKCSVVLLIRYIFTRDGKRAWRLCNITLGVLAAWGFLAILTCSMECSTSSVLAKDPETLCPNQATRWKVIIAFDAATELGMVFLFFSCFLPLQMAMSSKVLVIITFSFRIPNILFSSVFLFTYLTHLKRSAANHGDPSLSIAVSSAWLESALAYSLISATVPCLNSFMRRFQTGGTAFTRPMYSSHGPSNHSNSRSNGYTTGADRVVAHAFQVEQFPLKNVARSVTSKTRLRRDNGSWAGNSVEDDSIIEIA